MFDRLAGSAAATFTDTSFIETVVFAERAGITLGPGLEAWLRAVRDRVVFLLEPLEKFESTAVRLESAGIAASIAAGVAATGFDFGVSARAAVLRRAARGQRRRRRWIRPDSRISRVSRVFATGDDDDGVVERANTADRRRGGGFDQRHSRARRRAARTEISPRARRSRAARANRVTDSSER